MFKKIGFLILGGLLLTSPLYATATSETGDNRARPMSLYGKTSAGVVTAFQVDSDGKLVTSGGGGGAWTATADGAYLDGDATMTGTLTVNESVYCENLHLTGAGTDAYIQTENQEGTVYINDDCKINYTLTTTGNAINFLNLAGVGDEKGHLMYDNTDLMQLTGSGVTFVQGVTYNRTTVSDADYTALKTDYIIAYTSLTADRTLTLPSDANTGQIYIIKDEGGDTSTYDLIIDPAGSATIDGDLTQTINYNYDSTTVYFDGTDYYNV